MKKETKEKEKKEENTVRYNEVYTGRENTMKEDEEVNKGERKEEREEGLTETMK